MDQDTYLWTKMATADTHAQKAIRGFGSSKCPHHHGQEVVYVCEDCGGELACVKCATSIHKRHALEDLSEIMPEVNQNLQDCVNKLEQTDIPLIDRKVKTANDKVLYMEKYYKTQIQELENKRRSLMGEIEKLRNDEKQNMEVHVSNEKQIRSQLENMKSKLNEVKETLLSEGNVLKYDVANKLNLCIKGKPTPTYQRTVFSAQLEQYKGKLRSQNNPNYPPTEDTRTGLDTQQLLYRKPTENSGHMEEGTRNRSQQPPTGLVSRHENGTGNGTGNTEVVPKFKVPDPVTVANMHTMKVQFLLSSNVNKTALEKELKSAYARIIWPSESNAHGHHGQLKLECLLTKDTEDSQHLVKHWEENSIKILSNFFSALVVYKLDVSPNIWENMLKELQSLNITHPDGGAITARAFQIFVSGHQQYAGGLARQVQGIIQALNADFDRKMQKISKIVNVEYHELMFLSLIHFSDEMEQKYEYIQVELNLKRREVLFYGTATDVNSAKASMSESISSLKPCKVPAFSQRQFNCLQNTDVKKNVARNMKENNLIAVWEMEGDYLVVYATNDNDAITAARVLKDSVLQCFDEDEEY